MNDLWLFSNNSWNLYSNFVSLNIYTLVTAERKIPSLSQYPGGRMSALLWESSVSGALLLFGGRGLTGNLTDDSLNDLWSFNLSTRGWTWISGDPQTTRSLGVYSISNNSYPAARYDFASAFDKNGNAYIFGGMVQRNPIEYSAMFGNST